MTFCAIELKMLYCSYQNQVSHIVRVLEETGYCGCYINLILIVFVFFQINKLSPPRRQDIMPPSSASQSPPATTDSHKTADHPLETYNGGFLNIEVDPSAQNEERGKRNRGAEVAYDDDFLNIHGNEEMELF